MAKVKKAVDAAVDASRSVKSALNDLLDMSTEARKARAAEQGYSGGLYHGTDSDIKEYSGPTWLTDDPKDASQYSDRQAWFNQDVEWDELDGRSIDEFSPKFDDVPLAGQNVQPLMTRAKNTLDISDLGPETTLDDVVNALVDYDVLSEKPSPEEMIDWIDELNMRNDSMTFVSPGSTHPTWAIIEGLGLDKDIQSSGWDALKIADIAPDGRTMSGTLVFDPKNIRSVNATFDPAKRESANLLAGLGGAAVLGASVEDAEAAKLKVFHRTTQEAADAIRRSGMAHSNEPGFFVSNRRDGQAVGYGDGVVELSVPEERLVLDDEFPDGEQHFRINPNSLKHDLSGYELGFSDPAALAVTAAITGAATEFYRRRESKKGFWQQRREELSELINAGDEFIRPAMPYINSALEALDKPMQGYYGVASALGALAEGNSLDASLQRGATVARQPIEQTAQEYGGALADQGYPLAGTALNTTMQIAGPF